MSHRLAASLTNDAIRIAVVGGSAEDPELGELIQQGFACQVTTFGLENSDVHLDLNHQESGLHSDYGFDLVLCSQVLEHVWNHSAFFHNVLSLVRSEGGLVWLAAPKINRPHASPYFYSAGFAADYLTKNLEASGFTVLESGELGSRRLYEGALLSETWFTRQSYRFPPLSYLLDSFRPWKSRLSRTVIGLPQNLRMLLLRSRISSDPRWATESWTLAQRH